MSVTTWRARFLAHRLDGLVDLPRSGTSRAVADTAIEGLVTLTLESQPANASHWSTRAMAQRVGMSQSMVLRVWRAFGLQPHKADTFKLSTDPAFVDKVRDIVGLYLAPPHRAVVLCVDETQQIQALKGTAPCCRCGPASWSAELTVIVARVRPVCSLPSTSRPGRYSANAQAGIVRSSSAPSLFRSRRPC